ncbi:phosphatidate cytidylyltransferase [Anabaena cylindrica UHCC 0172]|uniref:diacylglycerol/polyprenol kinase family protein n=1 Tax=Anabaena cylindrica TaxID=1165 RepID=UPI002B20DC39|nr:phosphatidate cytidylyltransferase [Anabaena cylindrica]MEA5551474.1 phosphatidate cytidylyltransferase [Anabaena cylindrica UHCC 0172]
MNYEFITTQDLIGLFISYLYAISLLLFGEGLHRFFGVKQDITRKIIHIGGGMWVFAILLLFKNWQIGIIPFATFIGINYLLYRYRFISAMDREDSSPGTVYFAISITLLFALLWRPNGLIDNVPIAVAGAMSMTWGDALAALIGKRFGKHQYQVGNSIRSWEGSAVMFLVSTTVIFLVLWLLPGSLFSPLATLVSINRAILAAILSGACATLVEGISPSGTDNLSVPLATAALVWSVMQV